MIAVSNAFKEAWADLHDRVVHFKVEYRRREWNGVDAYVLEAETQVVEMREIIKLSPITWKLDSSRQNQILSSNMTIRLKNDGFKWNEKNINDGIFKDGQDPYKTEFQVFVGYQVSEDPDDIEYATVFTGEAIDYIQDSDSMAVDITLRGRESKLQVADAQRVATTFTNEPTVPASGLSGNKIFAAKVSVWEVTNVRVAASGVGQGSRYKLSQVNDAELPTLITIDPAPADGEAVDWSGRQWKRNYRVSELVNFLLDEAGIGAAPTYRSVEEPLYPGTASFQKVDSQAEFGAGVRVNVEYISEPGKIGRQWFNYETGDSTANWTSYATPITTDGTRLVFGGNNQNGPVARGVVHDKGGGSFEVKLTRLSAGGGFFMMVFPFGYRFGTEYGFYIQSGFGANFDVAFVDSGRNAVGSGGGTIAADVESTIRMTLEPDTKAAKLYIDGVLKATAALPSGYSPDSMSVWNSNPGALSGDTIKIRDVRYSPSVEPSEASTLATATFTSAVIDTGSTPTAWGKVTQVAALNGGTVSYETATSTDGMAFDAFVAVGVDGMILSALKRYIKVRATIAPAAGYPVLIGPVIDVIQVNYYTVDLLVGHADFKERTVFAAISRLAEITDMEYGFDGAGKFFFRNKAVAPVSILDLNQSNAVIKIGTVKPGYDRVLNCAQVTYNDYYEEVDSASMGEAAPTSVQRFGRKIIALEINDFLFSNNANYAEAIAKLLRNNNYLPKRTMRVEARLIPHLELADVVKISYYDSPFKEQAYFGDALADEPTFGTDHRVLVREMLAKVVGLTTDVQGGKSAIELQEVLS